ncbi:MAG: feruloyl-CoA synthase [Solirubrobacteraceae bacterium]|jgi:feruloyl-CoA synthase|nr:feruloyl-CoA synthase [Solirubrobacteraceae bacterium]
MPDAVLEVFAAPQTIMERRDDGVLVLRSAEPLGDHAPSMAHLFRSGAEAHPERVLATRREGDGRRALTWGAARERADALAQALLDHGLGPDRPLMVLSGNSLEHLELTLAAYTAGVPILPISPAYSLMSADHERVRSIAARSTPGMVFADDAARFGAALDAIDGATATQVVAHGERDGALALEDLARTVPGDDVERAFDRLGPRTVAKILFTSGSTGAPKGVVNTHRMICSNQQALGQVWPFMRQEPPVLADWLPWSHTFGANHNLHQAIAFGGTLHIDDGKPVPQLFDQTVETLRAIRPTVYYNVPAGYALLTPRLEADRDLAEAFFSRLRFMFYAAAALPEALWDRLRAVADEVAGHHVPLTASWGTTETAPAATTAHFAGARCGCIGVPLPGVTLKLVPDGVKREIRVSGPNVAPGYHRDAGATAAAFDEEGFYRTGDAARLVDEDDPDQGLMFDGRLAEDFKLMSGTWVTVGRLRIALLSAAGVLRDAVIAGHDREAVAALAWLDPGEARRVCGSAGDVALDDPRLRAHLAACLGRINEDAGSAARIERLLLLAEPPDLDAGEITDKGYVNQRAVLERRADDVARLFGEPLDESVIATP